MARARNIKPGFFRNEFLVEMPIGNRLLFIGLWTLADRDGRVEDRPKRIKLDLFPCDSFDVDIALGELAEAGFIERYEASGVKVISIINFLKHQTPHGTEKDSALPDKDGNLTVHERSSGGYVTGNKRHTNIKTERNNVISEKNNVNPPLTNREPTVNEHPDSPNPDSLNPEYKNPVAPAKPLRFDPTRLELPEKIDSGSWLLWIEYRRQRRLSCARMCVEQQLANLSAWADAGYDPGEIIRASIANGWQGLFEPKTKPAQKPLNGKSKARLNHLGVVEELQSFGGINSWASTGYTSIAEYEAAQKEAA